MIHHASCSYVKSTRPLGYRSFTAKRTPIETDATSSSLHWHDRPIESRGANCCATS